MRTGPFPYNLHPYQAMARLLRYDEHPNTAISSFGYATEHYLSEKSKDSGRGGTSLSRDPGGYRERVSHDGNPLPPTTLSLAALIALVGGRSCIVRKHRAYLSTKIGEDRGRCGVSLGLRVAERFKGHCAKAMLKTRRGIHFGLCVIRPGPQFCGCFSIPFLPTVF